MKYESELQQKEAAKIRKKNPDVSDDKLQFMVKQEMTKKRRLAPFLYLAGGVVCTLLTAALYAGKGEFFSEIRGFTISLGVFAYSTFFVTLISRWRASKPHEPRPLDQKRLHREIWVRPLLYRGALCLLWALIMCWFLFSISRTKIVCIVYAVNIAIPVLFFSGFLFHYMKIRKQIVAGEFSVSRGTILDKGYEDEGGDDNVRYRYYLFFPDHERTRVSKSVYYSFERGEDCWLVAIPQKKKDRCENKIRAVFRAAEWEMTDDIADHGSNL